MLEDRRTGYSGWKDRQATGALCLSGISLVLWMSITSGRSRRFVGPPAPARRLTSRRNFSRGCAEISESEPLPSSDESEAADDLRRLLLGRPSDSLAQAGRGLRRRYCWRSLLLYSAPLTMSSASVIRSFRKRLTPARETASLSSSLSSQTGALPPAGAVVLTLSPDAPARPAPVSSVKRSASSTSSSPASSVSTSSNSFPSVPRVVSKSPSSLKSCVRKLALFPSTSRSSSSSSESLS